MSVELKFQLYRNKELIGEFASFSDAWDYGMLFYGDSYELWEILCL